MAALTAADFRLIGSVRKASRFFSADLAYPNAFDLAVGFRPYLQIEMTFEAPSLPPVDRPIHSLVARAQDGEPEIPAFP